MWKQPVQNVFPVDPVWGSKSTGWLWGSLLGKARTWSPWGSIPGQPVLSGHLGICPGHRCNSCPTDDSLPGQGRLGLFLRSIFYACCPLCDPWEVCPVNVTAKIPPRGTCRILSEGREAGELILSRAVCLTSQVKRLLSYSSSSLALSVAIAQGLVIGV